ncbi:cyclase family protein [Novosphingobium bradum]|uniref:Cyclase family protein n=1 Tax=Novosphingobium bradum TaxID=1737444 RepID=A0ABV7IPB7_9SPHN
MDSGRRWKRRPEGANWGDFGADDQIGRMNLLTPERRLAGAAEIREGLAFTLSLPLDLPGWGKGTEFRRPPRLFATTSHDGQAMYNLPIGFGTDNPRGVVCDDGVILCTQYSTQWDSLAHMGMRFDADDDGIEEIVYYNGYRAGEAIIAPEGDQPPVARALGIENLATAGVQGRAVVVSLVEAFGPGRTWVGHADLQRAMADQGCVVREGDFLLLHTGFDDALIAARGEADPRAMDQVGAVLDGRDPALRDWVRDCGLIAICADNIGVEGFGFADCSAGCDHSMAPLHDLCLFKLGIHLGEMWRTGELSRWLLKEGRSACFLTAPPLRLPGAVGSPVTPVATV